ncbi:MAG: hypothetical protein JO178_14285 [Chryseobacterium sp.]|nr:hypothetical protein [Chryseobacterium sp.]
MVFLLFPVLHAAALNGNYPTITLNGPWKFKTGDSMEWAAPNFNDSTWENINLTAPPGAHDGDVGLTGYTGGWTTRGHRGYSGYAWYRIKVSLDSIKGNTLAFTGPPSVDDAYQVFVNGKLLGGAGDFSDPVPVAYSIQPKMFLLPPYIRNKKQITIAFRVWMSPATLDQISDAGGIHIAPELGEKNSIELKYRDQWGQTIKGYILEVIEPLLFIFLAIMISILFKPVKPYKWLIVALILLAMVRANQAFYYWLQIETTHGIDIITTVILTPLVLGSWLMAWRDWYGLYRPSWIPPFIILLTSVYMASQLVGLEWVARSIPDAPFHLISGYTRFLFALLMILIIICGVYKEGARGWLSLPAVLLISTGLFAQELSQLHIQGIWFPFGVGVSRSQYAYAAFVIVMCLLLIYEKKHRE